MAHPFQKLAAILKSVAPTVLTAVGGPAGALAGTLVRKALNVQPDQDLEQAIADATLTPEGVERLRAAEIELKKFEGETGVKFAQLDIDDRASARELAKANGMWPQIVLSALFVCGYFTILGLFFAQELRVPMNEAFMVMLGVLTAGVPQILNFWLGSSHSSSVKTDALTQALSKE